MLDPKMLSLSIVGILNTLIKNKNTFWDYIKHAIIKGLSPEEYFQESLLHEAMHFCGCGGADPLKEGITELKTREAKVIKDFIKVKKFPYDLKHNTKVDYSKLIEKYIKE